MVVNEMGFYKVKKALVVDDIVLIRILLRQCLIKLGFGVVVESYDGKDAIDKFHIYSPDLITMDISMPGMEGVEAIKTIREFDANVKIVVVSAIGSQNKVIEAVSAGANNFIVKPFKEAKIIQVINGLFGIS